MLQRALKLAFLLFSAAFIMGGLKYWLDPHQPERRIARRAPAWADVDTSKPLNCLVSNDVYVVHLTTYIQTEVAGADPKRAEAFRPYCRNVPKTGAVTFSFDLIDKEARKLPVALAVSKVAASGEKALVKEQPAAVYGAGVAQISANLAEAGVYSVRLVFGEGKSADEQLEVPVAVGLAEH